MFQDMRQNWSGREDSNLRPLPPEDSAAPNFARKTGVLSYSDTGTAQEHSRFAAQFYRAVTAVDLLIKSPLESGSFQEPFRHVLRLFANAYPTLSAICRNDKAPVSMGAGRAAA